jgi:hypothetical protein
MKVTEVMKEVGIRWRLLEAEEKHSFEERAREDKSRYITEVRKQNIGVSISCSFKTIMFIHQFE